MVSISAFTAFLISGLVIIAIFSIIGGFIQTQTEPSVEKTAVTKSLSLEFSISKLRETRDIKLPDMLLQNGLLFDSNKLKYSLDLPNDTEEVALSFDIVRTNRYGPLTIKAGRLSESRKFPTGHYTFNIENREGSIPVEINPESSFWRIWAPTLYKLNNTKVTIGAFKTEKSDYSFNLEVPAESASLILQLDKNSGNLDADLNGDVIYSGSPKPIETIPINVSLIKKDNKITFNPANNSQFAGRGTLIINYK